MPTSSSPTTHTFPSHDGATIAYRHWPATTPPSTPTGAPKSLLLFHRGHEHSARWQQTVESLQLNDVNIFAWDQRGHGASSGERGHAPNLACVTKDADCFARHLAQHHGLDLNNTVVLAHSVGAVVATAWVHDFAPPVRGLVLGAPALRVKLYVPLAIPALRLKQALIGPGTVKSYVKAKMLTHDPAEAAAYQADPQIFRQIAVNILLDLHDTATRLIDDAGAITTPTLILAAEKDWIVTLDAQRRFFERLGSSVKQFEVLPGFYHALFHEHNKQLAIDHARRFIQECFARPSHLDHLVQADRGGHTRTEHDLLRAPASPAASPRWALTRAAIGAGAALSEGMKIGRTHGFDSGVMLDYVYENKPRGVTPLGKLVDRNYLNAIGWRGIRVRREHLQRALRSSMEALRKQLRPVRILDIASGPGRYVLETMQSMRAADPSAILRDNKPANVQAAAALAQKLGLSGTVRCELGDAFDADALADIRPRPTIAIASGLYELFPSNDPVRQSLAGLERALEPEGLLIYTCQPWHPQMEFIARALTNREGHPWIMRRRTQAEMDALVREAGFEKLDQDIDQWGIFTVSVARKLGKE